VTVHDLRFTPAPRRDRRTGLLGWVAFRIGAGWRADGVAVRRTRRGRLALSYPARIDGAGREHPFLLPACDGTRLEVEAAVRALLEEPHQVVRPAPRGAHVEAPAAHEQAEDAGADLGGRHGAQGTPGGRRR